MSAPTELTLRGSADILVANTSSSLASAAALLGSVYNPTSTGYSLFQMMLSVAFASAPTAGTAIALWLLLEDGSGNYESGSSTGPIVPARNPDIVFPVLAQTPTQLLSRNCLAPAGPCKPLILNQGTGQTMSAGWTLTCIPFTYKAPTQ